MSKQTKNKRKNLKINKSGIKTMRLNKQAMAREAEALKIRYMTEFNKLMDFTIGANDDKELFDILVKERETLDKVIILVTGTKFFQDQKSSVKDLIKSIRSENETNEENAIYSFKQLITIMMSPESKNMLHAAIIINMPIVGHFVGEYLSENNIEQRPYII